MPVPVFEAESWSFLENQGWKKARPKLTGQRMLACTAKSVGQQWPRQALNI